MKKPCNTFAKAFFVLLIALAGLFSCQEVVKPTPEQQPCRECHAKLSSGHDRHFSLSVRVAGYGDETSMKNTAGYAYNCGVCHPLDPSLHKNGKLDIELSNSSARELKALSKKGSYNAAAKTCSDVYCHFFKPTPAWGGKFEAAKRCQSCHDTPPLSGGHFNVKEGTGHMVGIHWDSAGGHGKDTGKEFIIGCNTCHYGVLSKEDTTFAHELKGKKGVFTCSRCHEPGPGDIRDYSLHANGKVDVIFSPYKVRSRAQLITEVEGWKRVIEKGSKGAYDESVAPLNTAAYKQETKTCLNVSCHLGVPVRWNEKVDCASCHKGY